MVLEKVTVRLTMRWSLDRSECSDEITNGQAPGPGAVGSGAVGAGLDSLISTFRDIKLSCPQFPLNNVPFRPPPFRG